MPGIIDTDSLAHALWVADQYHNTLTIRQLRVLLAAYATEKSPTEADLVKLLELSRQEVAVSVDQLEKMELVGRLHEGGAGRYRIFKSPAGRRLVKALRGAATAAVMHAAA